MDLLKSVDLGFYVELGIVIALIGMGITWTLKHTLKRLLTGKTNRRANDQLWDMHSEVHEALTEARTKVDAARAMIIQFHNGEYFLDGSGVKKMSTSHESLRYGISSCGEKLQNILISMCVSLLRQIKKDKAKVVYLQRDWREEDASSYCKNFLELHNVLAFCVQPLKHHGLITGFVMFQWCATDKVDNIDEKVVETIIDESVRKISTHLTLQADK
jgi:hypothetical protein